MSLPDVGARGDAREGVGRGVEADPAGQGGAVAVGHAPRERVARIEVVVRERVVGDDVAPLGVLGQLLLGQLAAGQRRIGRVLDRQRERRPAGEALGVGGDDRDVGGAHVGVRGDAAERGQLG